jgi:CheY-like chemotaxis protein
MSSNPDATHSSMSPSEGEATARGRVLLVDDEAMVVRVIARLLSRAGFDVTVFTDSREALRAIESDPRAFDVMVTDMTMPGMSGIELARGAAAVGAPMPVVLLSGWIDAEAERAARAAGIARVLSKPIQVATLVDVVIEVLPTLH